MEAVIDTNHRDRLRAAVRFFYDLQKFRITSLSRVRVKHEEEAPTELSEEDQAFLDSMGSGLRKLERDALKEIVRHGATFSIWERLLEHKGVGPTIAGFLVAEFDIHKAVRPSQFWSFAGLGVRDGHSPHPVKGEKLKYNAWLRSKCIAVLGGCLLKAKNEDYRPVYDNYRHRKETMRIPCMLCGGSGKASQPKKDAKTGRVSTEAGKLKKCWNCVGSKLESGPFTPEAAPWGKGDAHRHQAALRVMVKQFLLDFWKAWREAEGLPVVPSYHEAKQGHRHGE